MEWIQPWLPESCPESPGLETHLSMVGETMAEPGASCRLEQILLFKPHLSNVHHILISRVFMSFLQVDVTPNGGNHPKIGNWDSYEHIDQATGILAYFVDRIGTKFPGWSGEQKLKGLSAEQRDLTVRYTLCFNV